MKPRLPSSSRPGIGIAICSLDVDAARSGAVQLFPMGAFRTDDGRPTGCASWTLTPAIARQLVAATSTRTTPYCFDYDHQTLLAKQNGKPAPAAGWFSTLEARDDGLWATGIEWTATGPRDGGVWRVPLYQPRVRVPPEDRRGRVVIQRCAH
ncbi:MAG: phage protease [Burkholderia gladioli]